MGVITHQLNVENLAELRLKLPLLFHKIARMQKEERREKRIDTIVAAQLTSLNSFSPKNSKQEYFTKVIEGDRFRFAKNEVGVWEFEREIAGSLSQNKPLANNEKETPFVLLMNWLQKYAKKTNVLFNATTLPKSILKVWDFFGDVDGYSIYCRKHLQDGYIDLSNPVYKVNNNFSDISFTIIIQDSKKEPALRFSLSHYKAFMYIAGILGDTDEEIEKALIDFYKELFKTAGNDKDQLDKIYENIPPFVIDKLRTLTQLESNLDQLLDQNISDYLGADEDKGILNILKNYRNRAPQKLYNYLYAAPEKVIDLYKTFSGNDRRNFVAFIMDLCKDRRNSIPEAHYAVLPNGYYQSHIILEVELSDKNIYVKKNTESLTTNLFSFATKSHKYKKTLGGPKKLNTPFYTHPMDFITLRSEHKNNGTREESDQLALSVKYQIDELESKAFWDFINVATSLAGGYGAVRVLAIKGTGWLLKTAAVVEITKEALEIIMLSEEAQKTLKDAGLGVLVDNWTAISIVTDLTFLSLDGIVGLIRNGRKGTDLLEQAGHIDEASHLSQQTEKAYKAIEETTGVDVRKMSEVEFDEFVENNPILKETKQKVERTKAFKEHESKLEEKFHDHFDGELRFERASNRDPTEFLRGVGGHNHSVIGENVVIRRYLTEPLDNMPFDALISVRYGHKWLEKVAKSTMFPKNWDIIRVKEEVTLVYDKMIKSGKFEELRKRKTPKYDAENSIKSFRIRIEFDTRGNITNAYPILR